jgi:hypothetical protein
MNGPGMTDWKLIGERVCSLLTSIYVDYPEQFRKQAVNRCITVEQLAASAIAKMIREELDDE